MRILKLFLLLLITIIIQDQLTAQDDRFDKIMHLGFENHVGAPLEYTHGLYQADWYPGALNAGWSSRNSDSRWPGWWTGALQDSIVIDPETSSKVMKFSFEDTIADGYSGSSPIRGGDYWCYDLGAEYQEIYFSYNIKFSPNWDPVMGGKLPAVNGGAEWSNPDLHQPYPGEGFSLGMMFDRDDGIHDYFYYQGATRDNLGQMDHWNSFQPPGLDYENFPFASGKFVFDYSTPQWYNITYRIVMNTITGEVANSDGIYEGFVNGKLVHQRTNYLFIDASQDGLGVNNLAIALWFGGAGDLYKPSKDEWGYLDDFICFTYHESVDVPRGNIPSPPDRVLELPNLKTAENDIEIPTIPGTLDVSIVDIKNTQIPNMVISESKANSFGHSELYEYGLTITKSEEPITNEIIIFASQDFSEILNTERVSSGLKALYVFDEGEGNQILDNSGTDPPVNLEIQNPSETKWLAGRGLKVEGNTIISSNDVPTELINSITSTNEITLEAWIRPADINQSGPARIFSLSRDHINRAFTLGHEGDPTHYNYIARLNTTSGNPEVSTDYDFNSLNLHQVVYTRDSNGEEKIFVNGQECYTGVRGGDFSSMSGEDYYLSIANEMTGERPWIGTYYLLAIYNKALNKEEIDKNFSAGLGEIRYTINLLIEPNVTYLVTPFAKTDQGVIYGSTEVLRPWSNTSVSPFEDHIEPYHSVDR